MKKIFSVVLILLICSFGMAFFSGCDSNKKYMVVTVDTSKAQSENAFEELTKEEKRDYDLALKATQAALDCIEIEIYASEKDYRDGKEPITYNLKDPNKPKEDAKPMTKFSLKWVKFNGGSCDLSLSSPGKKKLVIYFDGTKGTCEYTVTAIS